MEKMSAGFGALGGGRGRYNSGVGSRSVMVQIALVSSWGVGLHPLLALLSCWRGLHPCLSALPYIF